MPQLLASILDQVRPETFVDIGIVALLIYWVFSLIRGTSAVRLVIGVGAVFAVYFAARTLNLLLLTQILETSAVVGLFALVVVFQPELRRALDRIGRVGSLGWLVSAEDRNAETIATEVARAAAVLSAENHGALIVIERETGLEQIAESGVMIHGDLSADLLRTIFSPKSPLHDGAVIVRGARVLAAGALLPLGETTIHHERFGTRHRAALGTTEQTDAIVVVVSEENGHVSLVQRARIVRNLNESQLAQALRRLLEPSPERRRRWLPAGVSGVGGPRLSDIGRAVRSGRRNGTASAEPIPADEPMIPEPPAPSDDVVATELDADVADAAPTAVADDGNGAGELTDGTEVTEVDDEVAERPAPAAAQARKKREPAETRGPAR
jgi:diadenylate cyclase